MTELIIRELTAEQCTCGNDHPELDEFIAGGVDVHFEAMGPAQFWIGITDPATGREWSINCGAVNTRAKGYSRLDEYPAGHPIEETNGE